MLLIFFSLLTHSAGGGAVETSVVAAVLCDCDLS